MVISEFSNELSKLRDLMAGQSDEDIKNNFEIIEQTIHKPIHSSIKKIVSFSDFVNTITGVFSGYELFSATELQRMYEDVDGGSKYFSEYSLDSEFKILNQVIEVYVEDHENDNLNRPEISDLSRLLPIGSHKADYLVVDLMSESGNALYELSLGHSAFLYSPSISQHIDYLISGCDNGNVSLEEGSLEFPVCWYQRLES